MSATVPSGECPDLFESAEWYDRSINWDARLGREIPVLEGIFGPPAVGGLLDAGCGTGRQACALAERGYQVTAADNSAAMLAVAERHAARLGVHMKLVRASYEQLPEAAGSGFDGVYCLGNALAAAGSREAVRGALDAFARCLRPGGRFFLQVLNFDRLRRESPCVRGPRISTVEGREYVSVRHFHFMEETVAVTNVTLWKEDRWRLRAHEGTLYPVSHEELLDACRCMGLHIDGVWGAYDLTPCDPRGSDDLLLRATRA